MNNKNQIEKLEAITFDKSIMGINGKSVNIITPFDTIFKSIKEARLEDLISETDIRPNKSIVESVNKHTANCAYFTLVREMHHITSNYMCNVIMMFIDDVYRNSSITIPEDMFASVVDSSSSYKFNNMLDILYDNYRFLQGGKINTKDDMMAVSYDIITNNTININTVIFTELSDCIRSIIYFEIEPDNENISQSESVKARDALYALCIQSLNNAISLCTPVLMNQMAKMSYNFSVLNDYIPKIPKNKNDEGPYMF